MKQEDLPLCEEDSEASSYRRHLSDILGGGLLSVHKNQGKLPPCVKGLELPPCVKGLEKTSLCKGESREARKRRTRSVASSATSSGYILGVRRNLPERSICVGRAAGKTP